MMWHKNDFRIEKVTSEPTWNSDSERFETSESYKILCYRRPPMFPWLSVFLLVLCFISFILGLMGYLEVFEPEYVLLWFFTFMSFFGFLNSANFNRSVPFDFDEGVMDIIPDFETRAGAKRFLEEKIYVDYCKEERSS